MHRNRCKLALQKDSSVYSYVNNIGFDIKKSLMINSRSRMIPNRQLHVPVMTWLKGAFLPHSWEDINTEINFSQMLLSARIYRLPLADGLCCIQTTHTVQKLHW